MPKKKQVAESSPDAVSFAPDPEPSFENAASSASFPDDKPSKSKRLGVFIPLADDGSVDEKRLKGDFSRLDSVRKALNLSPGAASEQVKSGMEVSSDFVKGMYSAFEVLVAKAGVLFLRWPRDLAGMMKYSEEQKDKLTPPTKAVIEKFAPKWLVANQELATFAVVFTAVTQEMVQNALVKYVAANPQVIQQPAAPEPSHVEGDATAPAVQ